MVIFNFDRKPSRVTNSTEIPCCSCFVSAYVTLRFNSKYTSVLSYEGHTRVSQKKAHTFFFGDDSGNAFSNVTVNLQNLAKNEHEQYASYEISRENAVEFDKDAQKLRCYCWERARVKRAKTLKHSTQAWLLALGSGKMLRQSTRNFWCERLNPYSAVVLIFEQNTDSKNTRRETEFRKNKNRNKLRSTTRREWII